MLNPKYLSASKIKLLKDCSWKYWCKYVLNLPEKSNDGANRGTVCHLVFEVLGNPRHKKHFQKIIAAQDVFASDPVRRLILKEAKKLGVEYPENLTSICEMTLAGLNHDFMGLNLGKPTKALSEFSFKIECNEPPKRYNVQGFIDKLFLYKKKKKALIRDFKTSKEKFKGKDIDNNFQDWIYGLATYKHFPEYNNRNSEFVFLKFMKSGGVVGMEPITDDMLDAFEYELTYYQDQIENFGPKEATSNFAANQGWPTENSFSGKLSCGYASFKGQTKKDGSLMWHCPYKFAFKYIAVINPDGEISQTFFIEDFDPSKVPPDHIWLEMEYDGCPAHKQNP